jgi:hypothetical protein
MRASKRASDSRACGRVARNRGDSGRMKYMTAAASSGSAPPTTNTLRQPYAGISSAASMAPSMPPTGTPTWMAPIICGRSLRGENSAMSAVGAVNAPPSPMPVMNRHTASVATLVAVAQSSDAAPNSAVLSTSVRRRPQRSPSAPMPVAPSAMPTSEAASAGPSAARSTCRPPTSEGATKPTA